MPVTEITNFSSSSMQHINSNHSGATTFYGLIVNGKHIAATTVRQTGQNLSSVY